MLEKNGVKQRVDLPGVGENHMGMLCFITHASFLVIFNADHKGSFLPFVATEDADTLDQLFRGTPEEVARKYTTNKGFSAETEGYNYSL